MLLLITFLALFELHEILFSPCLPPAEATLDSSRTLWRISHSCFCVISKLAEDTLCPRLLIINEGVKQDWTQYSPLGYTNYYCKILVPLILII